MGIETIEARNVELAALKSKYIYEKGQAKLAGGQLDAQISRSLKGSIDFGKLSNTFDFLDLKFDRWMAMPSGAIDPAPFRQLLGEMRHLQRKLDQFSEKL